MFLCLLFLTLDLGGRLIFPGSVAGGEGRSQRWHFVGAHFISMFSQRGGGREDKPPKCEASVTGAVTSASGLAYPRMVYQQRWA